MAVESQTADDEQTETDGANSQARETAERVADIGLAEVEHVAEDGSLFAVAGVNTLNEGMTDPDDSSPLLFATAPRCACVTDDIDDYGQQWDDLDPKVLLAQLLAEQQRTNQLLTQVLDDTPTPTDDAQDATPMYDCRLCTDTVPEDDRERHARDNHAAPPGDADRLFTRVE